LATISFRDDEAVAGVEAIRSLRARIMHEGGQHILIIVHVDHDAQRFAMSASARQLVGAQGVGLPPVVTITSLSVVLAWKAQLEPVAILELQTGERSARWPFMPRIQPFSEMTTGDRFLFDHRLLDIAARSATGASAKLVRRAPSSVSLE
jgi:hypothetical protein